MVEEIAEKNMGSIISVMVLKSFKTIAFIRATKR